MLGVLESNSQRVQFVQNSREMSAQPVFEAFYCMCTDSARFGGACSSVEMNWSAVRSHVREQEVPSENLPRQSTTKPEESACVTSMSHTSSRLQPNPSFALQIKGAMLRIYIQPQDSKQHSNGSHLICGLAITIIFTQTFDPSLALKYFLLSTGLTLTNLWCYLQPLTTRLW